MKNLFVRFAKDAFSATAIEYGLITAGIVVAIVTYVDQVGSDLNTLLSSVSTGLQ